MNRDVEAIYSESSTVLLPEATCVEMAQLALGMARLAAACVCVTFKHMLGVDTCSNIQTNWPD